MGKIELSYILDQLFEQYRPNENQTHLVMTYNSKDFLYIGDSQLVIKWLDEIWGITLGQFVCETLGVTENSVKSGAYIKEY